MYFIIFLCEKNCLKTIPIISVMASAFSIATFLVHSSIHFKFMKLFLNASLTLFIISSAWTFDSWWKTSLTKIAPIAKPLTKINCYWSLSREWVSNSKKWIWFLPPFRFVLNHFYCTIFKLLLPWRTFNINLNVGNIFFEFYWFIPNFDTPTIFWKAEKGTARTFYFSRISSKTARHFLWHSWRKNDLQKLFWLYLV